jgi:hypothetical protein
VRDLKALRLSCRAFCWVTPKIFTRVTFNNIATLPRNLRKILNRRDLRTSITELRFDGSPLRGLPTPPDYISKLKRIAALIKRHNDVVIQTLRLENSSHLLIALLYSFAECNFDSIRHVVVPRFDPHRTLIDYWSLARGNRKLGALVSRLETVYLPVQMGDVCLSWFVASATSLRTLHLHANCIQDYGDPWKVLWQSYLEHMPVALMSFIPVPERLQCLVLTHVHIPYNFLTSDFIHKASVREITFMHTNLVNTYWPSQPLRAFQNLRNWQGFIDAFQLVYSRGLKRLTVGDLRQFAEPVTVHTANPDVVRVV